MSSRYGRVLVAAGFNILFEYSMRGVGGLVRNPILPFFLAGIYFPYFLLLDDAIDRYGFRDVHLFLTGFAFGLLISLVLPSAPFVNVQFLHINWLSLLFINVVWWGNLQGVFTFYIAQRMFRRNTESLLSESTRFLFILLLAVVLAVFHMSIKNAPHVEIEAFITILVLMVSTVAAVVFLLKRNADEKIEKSRFLDSLAVVTVGIFVISALLPGNAERLTIHLVNRAAVQLVAMWSMILFVAMAVYRIIMRRSVGV